MAANNALHQVTEKQRQTWNKFSNGWQKWDQKIQEISKSVTEKMLDEAKLTGSDHILDVSSGTGEPGLSAAPHVEHVIATDVSAEMLEIARSIAQKRGLNNFEIEAVDAENLPFSENQFDAVLCRFGVMFFANPAAGVQKMAGVLKPRGRMVLASWAEPPKNPFFTVASTTISKMLSLQQQPSADSPGIFRHSRPGQLTKLLEQANLKDIREMEIAGESFFDSPEEYWQLMIEVAPPIAAQLNDLSEEMRLKVKRAVMEATEPYHKGDKVVLPWASWVASGHK